MTRILPKRCLLLNPQKQPFTYLSGNCGAKFLKIFREKKISPQIYPPSREATAWQAQIHTHFHRGDQSNQSANELTGSAT